MGYVCFKSKFHQKCLAFSSVVLNMNARICVSIFRFTKESFFFLIYFFMIKWGFFFSHTSHCFGIYHKYQLQLV